MIHLDIPEKRRLHSVVVFLRNGIELVVMTSRALDRESENPSADRRDHVIEILVPEFRIVFLAEAHLRVVAKKACGDQRVRCNGIELISGELLTQELIPGSIAIKGSNHVIAISPGIRAVEIVLVAIRIGVARYIQPMPSPSSP